MTRMQIERSVSGLYLGRPQSVQCQCQGTSIKFLTFTFTQARADNSRDRLGVPDV